MVSDASPKNIYVHNSVKFFFTRVRNPLKYFTKREGLKKRGLMKENQENIKTLKLLTADEY